MRIGPKIIVWIDHTVGLESGEVVDSTAGREPLAFVFGRNEMIPGLEQALTDLDPRDQRDIMLPPEKVYGCWRPEAVWDLLLDRFPERIRPVAGMRLTVGGPEGKDLPFTITAVSDSHTTLDFNHALAGERITFAVRVVSVETKGAQGGPQGINGA